MISRLERVARWLRRLTRASSRRGADWRSASHTQFIPPHQRSALIHPAPATAVRAWDTPIDGTSTPLVRPYLTAYEREEKARIQRPCRDTLWCATYGVALDTRGIYAFPGAAW